jgi:hypothetical protein
MTDGKKPKKAGKPKQRKPRLIPWECVSEPQVLPSLVRPGPPTLHFLRRVPGPFCVAAEPRPGENYWYVQVLNENTEVEYAGCYCVEIPKKSRLPPWTPEDLAIACAKRLNEYRGLVGLMEYRDGVCVFQALFASNSMWTFCVRSSDPARCPVRKARPDGWQPGQDFPAGLPRKEGLECHHPLPPNAAEFSKMAQKQFA